MLAAEGTVRKRTDRDIEMFRGWEALGGHHIIAGAQKLQCLPITLPGLGLPGDKNEPIRAARSFREGGGKVERGRRYQLAVLHDGGDAAGPKTLSAKRPPNLQTDLILKEPSQFGLIGPVLVKALGVR